MSWFLAMQLEDRDTRGAWHKEGLAMGTMSLKCLRETQNMYTVCSVHQHTVTPEHPETESVSQGKPAESVPYVIRCCRQMIKPIINTKF